MDLVVLIWIRWIGVDMGKLRIACRQPIWLIT